MKHEELEKLIRRILITEDEEIDCGQAAELIAQYVELELSGEDVARLLPEVAQHLRQCDDCFELHEVLHEIAALEQEGALPDIDELLEEIISGEAGTGHPSQMNQTNTLAARPETGLHPRRMRDEGGNTVSPSLPSHGKIATRDVTPSTKAGATHASPLLKQPFWQRWSVGLAWATAAVALVIVAAVGLWAWNQSGTRAQVGEQYLAFIASADWVIRLKGTDQAPEAHGFIFVDADHRRALVIAKGLRPLPQEQVYRVWVQQGTRFLPGGTFQVKSNTWEAVFYISFEQMLGSKVKFVITQEPRPEGTAPTLPPLLEGMKDH